MRELHTLLKVKPEEVSGLLEEFNPNGCVLTENLSIVFHFVRFEDSSPRTRHFVSKLCDHIVHYCLNREKNDQIESCQIRQLYLEAKEKFTQPKNGKTGEVGELILYFLLEGYLRVPKVFSKMSLKTNAQMHIHGSDGVHLGINDSNFILYFGESKVYKNYSSAINDALNSVRAFMTETSEDQGCLHKDFEIKILSNNLDIPPGSLRESVLQVLDPYSKERSKLKIVHACFIGYEVEDLLDSYSENELINAYKKRSRSCYEHLVNKLTENPELKSLRWHFFFIPFVSVNNFRSEFLKELKR